VRVKIRHTRIQHAVGQGGFHSGSVAIDDRRPFRYVYDCGAQGGSRISTVVPQFVGQLRHESVGLDAVFLSHFHEDHFNGLDVLLGAGKLTATRIYLPYLDEIDRVIAVAASAKSPKGLVQAYLRDGENGLAGELGMGGAQFVPVLPSDPAPVDNGDDDTPPVDLPWSETDDGGGPLIAVTTGPRSGAEFAGLPNGPLYDDQGIVLGTGGPALWEFRLFVKPTTEAKRATFLDRLALEPSIAKRLNGSSVVSWLMDPANRQLLVSDPVLRAEAKHAYEAVAADLNVTSLSVYAGPAYPQNTALLVEIPGKVPSRRQERGVSWLGTGDGDLKTPKRVDEFVAHIRPFRLDRVSTLVVPHHGGAADIDRYFADRLKGAYAVYSYGIPNQHGHPTQAALDVTKDAGLKNKKVSNHTKDFTEQFEIEFL
jgi:hypothetical protein